MELTKPSLQNQLIAKLVNSSKAQQKMIDLLDDEIFGKLSKHDSYWDSIHEVEADKLEDCRLKIKWFYETLWDVISIMNQGTEDE